MKYSYKSIMKSFIKEYNQTHFEEINNKEIYVLYDNNPKVFASVEYLSSKGLIIIQKDISGKLANIRLTDKGISYFYDIRLQQIEYIKNLAMSKISDIIISSIVALITALIVA